jgi:initiation factor 1A
MLGNGRLEAQCFDGEKRLAHIRGKLRKKVSVVEEMAGEDRGVGGGQTWVGGGDAGH